MTQKKVKKKEVKRVKKTKVEERKDPLTNTKMENIYVKYEVVFVQSQVSQPQIELIEKVNEVLDVLDLGDTNIPITDNNRDSRFLTWTAEKLVSARGKLARYSEPLGEYISHHESRSDFAYIWRKGAYAKDWLPAKTELANTLDRVTNSEVESALIEKYLEEQFYSMFHRRRADMLIRKLEALDRMIRTIDHRLRELSRQYYLPQEDNFQGRDKPVNPPTT